MNIEEEAWLDTVRGWGEEKLQVVSIHVVAPFALLPQGRKDERNLKDLSEKGGCDQA
ncbi:MAG: hypothetical protein R6U98_25240 [Pirellulaceae bacterium]